MRFPELSARSLLGVDKTLPQDLPAARTLVLLPFRQWQQRQVDAWITLAEASDMAADLTLAGPFECAVIEVPCLSRRWGPARRFIDGGMSSGIGVPRVLARTWTSYSDVGAVQQGLGIVDSSQTWIGVVTPDGSVLEQALGEPSEAAWARISGVLLA